MAGLSDEERARRRRRRRWIRILLPSLGAALILVSIFVLFPISTFVDRNEIASGSFTGSIPADDLVIVPINLTEVGFVRLEAEVLPCSLRIGALTVIEIPDFNETHIFPRGEIDCQNPIGLFEVPATHVAFLNEHPTDSLTYVVQATYFTAAIPFAWVGWLAIGLILLGGLLALLAFAREW